MSEGYGWRPPQDWTHVQRYPFQADVLQVERKLATPPWYAEWIQGQKNACVGFGYDLMLSILNYYDQGVWRRYNPWWTWDRCKERDEWSDTNPGDNNGTSVNAACQVAKALGAVVVWQGKDQPPDPKQGISAYRWAADVGSMRASIELKIPISFAFQWMSGMDTITTRNGEPWYGPDNGYNRGGHNICIMGASDQRQAFWIGNSWVGYPPAWMAYDVAARRMGDYFEAALVTDLVTGRTDPQRRRRSAAESVLR